MSLTLLPDSLDSRKVKKIKNSEAEFWVVTLMITLKLSREVTKPLCNSVNGLRLSRMLELLQLKSFTRKSTTKLENHQDSPRKLLSKTPLETKRNSRESDLLALKEEKTSRRESKSDLKNSRNKRNDD